MELWQGSLTDFVRETESRSLTAKMVAAFFQYHRMVPNPSEANSWENSLPALAQALVRCKSKDISIALEYHLPLSGRRLDAILLGEGAGGVKRAIVVELKQWSYVDSADPQELNILVGAAEHVHPSQQALDYADMLNDTHSSFVEGKLEAISCSYCHNMERQDGAVLRSPIFSDLIVRSPVFMRSEEDALAAYIDESLQGGKGSAAYRLFGAGRFKPNPKLLEVVEETIRQEKSWNLVGSQRLAYNAISAELAKSVRSGRKSAVVVRGGPGTGKTVIAVQLLADALRRNQVAVHSTGGKAYTTTLRGKFAGAGKLFIWNLNTRKAPTNAIDLLLVDEAHRVRTTSDLLYTPKHERNLRSQTEELINAAKVTVFFLDENQYVRPDEVGTTALFKEEAGRLQVPVREYDLDVQFRCGGCTEYTDWVDYILGFKQDRPAPWRHRYEFSLADDLAELDALAERAKIAGERVRIVAGFCWEWSDVQPDGSLIPDVAIGTWARPWNAKRDPKKSYTPRNDPYTLWAETEAGEQQVGCIYSAQGFEFERVGVIWGEDLVWRDGQWIAQRKHSRDRPVRIGKADTLRLVRNAYRVLLTRGMKETKLFCVDRETQEHIKEMLVGF